VTMDRIPRERMGNATSLLNVTRNIGGSVGIAILNTLLANERQAHINIMGAHVDQYGIQGQQLLNNLTSAFMARGADAATALQQAYASAFGMVQQQAAMLAFLDGFRLLGVMMLAVAPLIFLMKRPSQAAEHPTVEAE